MTENDSFHHFRKKFYEVLHLDFRHYIPQGKPRPSYYRDVDYQLFKIWDSGVLPELTKEPILDEEVKQLDMFTHTETDKTSDSKNGIKVDYSKVKKKS